MKKIISMLLVIALLITFLTPVMASSPTVAAESGLEKVLKTVKSKIDIPADMKFSYNVYTQDDSTVWSLNWSSEEDQKYIYVTIDENDFITNYSSHQYTAYDKQLPKYSREQGRETAEKFLNKVNPGLLSEFKLVENNNSSQERDYYYTYIRQHNGIGYANNSINISVNSYTGQVTNFSCSYSSKLSFADSSKILTPDQAKKAFMEKLGLKLVYNVKYDKEKRTSYLAYVPKDTGKYIDAVTGEVKTYSNWYGIYNDVAGMKMEATASADRNGVVLTPEEIEAVNTDLGLLTKDEADKQLRANTALNIGVDFKLTGYEQRKDWNNADTYVLSLQYSKTVEQDAKQTRNISVTVDAKSGEIMSFWTYYYSPEDAKGQKTKDQAKAISDEILKKLFPARSSEVKFDDTYEVYPDDRNSSYNFRYVRIANGLEVPNDYITINYDNLSGNVTNVNSNWTKNLKFDDPKQAISLEKAYDVLFGKIGYVLQYIPDYSKDTNESSTAEAKIIVPVQNANKAVLGYFVDSSKPAIISAATGEILNSNGTAYIENVVADYTDIKGLSAENKIRILTQISIRYNGSELKPNESLLQKDYFLVLSKLNDLYYIDSSVDEETAVERMYTNLINSGIITKAEKAPNATLTREEAAKYFVKFLRLGQVAEIKGIFKSDFKDQSKISPELLGYVCIASGLKAMNGSNGNFNPKSKITRLEGLLTIYNYLSNK